MPPAGKSARNEQRKIRATYYNNTAVGLTVTAVLIPVFSVIQIYFNYTGSALENISRSAAPVEISIFISKIFTVMGIAFSSLLAWAGAVRLRDTADNILSEIED